MKRLAVIRPGNQNRSSCIFRALLNITRIKCVDKTENFPEIRKVLKRCKPSLDAGAVKNVQKNAIKMGRYNESWNAFIVDTRDNEEKIQPSES